MNPIMIVGEGVTEYEAISELIDQALMARIEYIEPETISAFRTFVGLSHFEPFERLRTSPGERRQDYRRAVRKAWGEPISHPVELVIATKLQEILSHYSDREQELPYLVIVKDTDADEECRDAIRNLRVLYEAERLVIGYQHAELECWLIAAFEPTDGHERQRLRDMDHGELPGCGFNPCLRSHDLTNTGPDHDGIKLSPKRVLRYLTAGDRSRALHGLHRDNHATLIQRGEHNGLADFLGDIRSRLIRGVFGV
jgi:hypothetical protein